MTGPFETMERSLRNGPLDEAGYRPAPIDASQGLPAHDGSGIVPIGPVTRLPAVPRNRMGSPWRYAVVVFVIVGLVASGIAYTSSRVGVGPVTVPTTGIGPLTDTFTSSRHGYSVRYPAGWTIQPATANWPPNVFLPVGNPGLDQLLRPGLARLIIASQPIGTGQREDDWLAAYFHPYQGGLTCPRDPSAWPRIPVSGVSGYLDANACGWPAEGRVSEPDVWFDALVFSGGRVYQIGLDGDVDLAEFQAILASVTLNPSAAID